MRFDLSVTIQRPPDEVFAFMADAQNYGDHGPDSRVPVFEKITPGPTRVGTRWHEVVQLAPGVRMTAWSEVTTYEPSRRFEESFRASWMRGRLEYSVAPCGEGSTLRQREVLKPRGPLRCFDRPIARMLRPNLLARLEAIRDMLEAGAVVQPA
jgi:hypothetical protein